MAEMFHGASPEMFRRAKELRERETPAEQVRHKRLDGYKFRRQHTIRTYVVDFYRHYARLVVEIDGDIHNHPEQRAYDEARTLALESLGLQVIRFTNQEVLENMPQVLRVIRERLDRASPDP